MTGASTRLSPDELSARTETSPEQIRKLLQLGILESTDGTFARRDVMRVRVLGQLEALGIPADSVATAVASGQLTLGYLESAGRRHPRSERTFAEVYGRRGIRDRALLALAGPVALLIVAMIGQIVFARVTGRDELVVPMVVESVSPGSAAEAGGVLPGDRLLSLGGAPLRDVSAISVAAQACVRCELIVERDGERRALSVAPQQIAGVPGYVLGFVPLRQHIEVVRRRLTGHGASLAAVPAE